MTVTVSFSPVGVLALVYAVIALMLLSAGYMDRSSFANPRYHEVIIIAAIWPVWVIQFPYYWITGRYLIEDINAVLGRDADRLSE